MPNRVEAAVLSAKNAGVFKTKDKLLITIGLASPDAKEVRGTLRIELVDAKGKSVGTAGQPVEQKDAAASYRFELPLTGLPANQVTLHCHLGHQQQFTAKL